MVLPLYNRLYSQRSPDHQSENIEILTAIETISQATQGKGVWVMDRGGDRDKLLFPLIKNKHRFLIRLRQGRDLIYQGRALDGLEIAQGCPMIYLESIIKDKLSLLIYDVKYFWSAAPSVRAENKDYPIRPVDFAKVHVTDAFWSPRPRPGPSRSSRTAICHPFHRGKEGVRDRPQEEVKASKDFLNARESSPGPMATSSVASVPLAAGRISRTPDEN
jgi:hypothetical protein